MDWTVVLGREPQRDVAGRRFENGVAVALEHLPRHQPHRRRILRDQHRLRAAPRLRRRGPGDRGGHGLVHARQVDLEGRSPPRLGIHGDEPARLLHDPVHGGEPQPGSFAGFLCREKRLEDAGLGLLVHADARIRHGQHDVPTRARFHHHVGRLDGQPPSPRHRVAGVDRQIDDDLLELPGIRLHSAQVGGEWHGEVNVRSDQPSQQFFGAGQDGPEIHDLGLEHLLAAEREQLAGKGRRALGGFANLIDVVAPGIVRGEIFQQQIPVAGDHGQEVVEVVRDASRQATHRFHFLRLAQLLLGAPQRLLGTLALDSDRHGARHRSQRLGHELGEGVAGEHRHDAEHAIVQHQGVAGERHQPLAPHPFLVVDLGIADDLVRELGTPVPGDHPDLVASQRHVAVGAVDVGIHAGARLQLQDLAGVVERPDTGQRDIEVAH